MRIVFMGTPEFAIPSLRALAEVHTLVAVYCQPDRRAGRGRTLTSPPIKSVAEGLGLVVRQPPVFDAAATAQIAADRPDLICVAAFGQIIPQEVLDVPTYGAVNVHASLLPRFRGAAPVERAILAGDLVTGVSIMRVEATLDTGPVARTVEVAVGEHTADTLADRLALAGADALLAVIESIEAGEVEWASQDESQATYAEKITKSDVALEPSLPASTALLRVRASSRRAASRMLLCGSPAVVISAELAAEADLGPGLVDVTDGLLLGFADGVLRVTSLRPENRAEMSGDSFVCGLRDDSPHTWESLA